MASFLSFSSHSSLPLPSPTRCAATPNLIIMLRFKLSAHALRQAPPLPVRASSRCSPRSAGRMPRPAPPHAPTTSPNGCLRFCWVCEGPGTRGGDGVKRQIPLTCSAPAPHAHTAPGPLGEDPGPGVPAVEWEQYRGGVCASSASKIACGVSEEDRRKVVAYTRNVIG
ncbi:hypothetical protein DFH07DRAFT_785279 [Mycena maculata]|uniref:Uncharacterized protein n=1 Tax=Mycena maculata TaxID=230809 RepID=A0AAD7MGZ7_9AGAR|nr:hypothetical protein DFH07DRAFT_785279 [Mycena maculata]